MADLPPDSGVRPAADRPPGTPRWVKVFGIIAVIVILLIAIMLLTGHGPGRHSAGSQVAPSGVMEAFAQPEVGGGRA